MIQTPAEMATVSESKPVTCPAKAARAGGSPGRAGVLAALVGLLLLGPNARGGFGEDLLTWMGIQVVEYVIADGLTQINNVDGGYGTGTLLGILGDTTTGQLDQISQQITVAQNMIAALQSDLDTFEVNVAADFQALTLQADKQAYDTYMLNVSTSIGSISNLCLGYNQVIALCFTNAGGSSVLRSNLSALDLQFVGNYATGTLYGVSLAATPDAVLTLLDEVTTDMQSQQDTVYDSTWNLLAAELPFAHQTYAGMYDLLNEISQLRLMALYFKKEYTSYQWSQYALTDTNATLSQYLSLYFLPEMTNEVGNINGDVAGNAILTTMATLLTNTVATNGVQRLGYLCGLINTNYPFPGGPLPAYKVVCNHDGRTYLIPTNAPVFPYQMMNQVRVPYPVVDYALYTADGRFQLANDTGNLQGLFEPDTLGNPLNYLTSLSLGNLTNLSSGVNGILLGNTVSLDDGNDQALYLLDAQAFNAGGNLSAQYLTNGGANVKLSQVVNNTPYLFSTDATVGLRQAAFLCIYWDTHIAVSPSLGTNAAGAYYPTTSGALGPLVSLAAGEVLDLSKLQSSVNTTVRICGDATLIGGGPGMTISNLSIETYGGSLTISNLFLSSATNIINNVSGPLTLVALGTNYLHSSLQIPYGYASAVIGNGGMYGGELTFTGPGSLVVSTSSTNMPAVQTAQDIVIRGARNLTFASAGPTSIQASMGGQAGPSRLFIVDSTVTSRVGVESDNEFVASPVTLENCSLDLTYGTINPTVIGHCSWLGAVRSTAQVTVQTDDHLDLGEVGTYIYLRMVGTTGTTPCYNIQPKGLFQSGSTVVFPLSYSVTNDGNADFHGLGLIQFIQLWTDHDWWCDSVGIAPNVAGDVPPTYAFHFQNGAGSHHFANPSDTQTLYAVMSSAYGYATNSDNTVAITGYTGPGGGWTVPSVLNGFPVSSINAGIGNCTGLTSVAIPSSVTSLGCYSFYHCYDLQAVYFQGNAPDLQTGPDPNGPGVVNGFAGATNATVYYLPGTTGWGSTFAGLRTALWVPFTYQNIEETVILTGYTGLGGAVIIPARIGGLPVTSIAGAAFYPPGNAASPYTNGISSVTIPRGVTNLNVNAFFNWYGLTDLYFQGAPPVLEGSTDAFGGLAIATVYYLPEPGSAAWGPTFGGLPTAVWEPFTWQTNAQGTLTITGYSGPGGTVVIPGALQGRAVTGIGTNAFAPNVFFSPSLLTNVLVPGSVTNLGDGAFQTCSNLAGVFFPGNAPSLGSNVFAGDARATVYYLAGATNWPPFGARMGGCPTAPWLTVNGGTAGSSYGSLPQVDITANDPVSASGLVAQFAQWIGATQFVVSATSANTTVNLPAQPITVTAISYAAPFITTQPASQQVLQGSNAVFGVTAWGPPPLAYQWYFNGAALGGATATNYSLNGVTTNEAGSYSVVVTNAFGSVTSIVGALTVLFAPAIGTQPASQVAAAGGTVTLSVGACGSEPLGFQWFKAGARVLGATNSALILANAAVTDSGGYYAAVTNAYGLNLSLPALVTVGMPQLLAWGDNQYGQLGDGTMTSRDLPQAVASNVVVAAAGSEHSLFVTGDGTLWGIGFNGDGELGDGTPANQYVPEAVASNVVAVAAGNWHSLFLRRDSSLWAMGQNSNGQLGDGTMNGRTLPEVVASNVVAVAAGHDYSAYLKNDGTLWTMGQNNCGQLGNGTLTNRNRAGCVASNVVAVAAGDLHCLYLTGDGTLWGVGQNSYGQLGDGTLNNRSTAEPVGSNVVAAAAGDGHSLYVTADGTLWATGMNDNGQLGDGATSNQTNAVVVASNVAGPTAGNQHSCFLKRDGTLWAMGWNNSGQLGDGTTTSRDVPVSVAGMALAGVVSGNDADHTLAVGVPLPPQITSQPLNQLVMAGSNVTFTAAADGFAPLAWQWYFNGSAIGGATATNYTVSGAAPGNAGSYTLVVTNLYGSVTSSVASLAVSTVPVGTLQVDRRFLKPGELRFTFAGLAGWHYALEHAYTLSPADWVAQSTNPADSGGMLMLTNSPDLTTNHFWRMRSVP